MAKRMVRSDCLPLFAQKAREEWATPLCGSAGGRLAHRPSPLQYPMTMWKDPEAPHAVAGPRVVR
jgi:hypothetical protein